MDISDAQIKKIDLLTTLPRRSESRLVLNVDTGRLGDVIRQIGSAWGIVDVEGCVLSYPCTAYGTLLVVASQDEWMYAVTRNFFRQRDAHGEPLLVNLHTQAAPPSRAELNLAAPPQPSAAAGSAEEQADRLNIHAAQEAHAAEIDKLKAANTTHAAEVEQLKATVTTQAQEMAQLNAARQAHSEDMAQKSAAHERLEKRLEELKSKFTLHSGKTSEFELKHFREASHVRAEVARLDDKHGTLAREIRRLQASESADSSRPSGKRSFDEMQSKPARRAAQAEQAAERSISTRSISGRTRAAGLASLPSR